MKIKCLENDINGKKFYLGYVSFQELVKNLQLKPLTVNRLTTRKRVEEMVEYIKEENSFYPPLVLAINNDVNCKYSCITNILEIEIESELDNLVIIDGQHRFKSILSLVKRGQCLDKRQAVYIIGDTDESEQRQIFTEINENMKSVSNVSKRIVKIEIVNYISLKTVIDLNIIERINFMNDQCTKQYPYKFIIEGNRKIFGSLSNSDFNADTMIDKLDEIAKISIILWGKVLRIIEENTNISIISKDTEINRKRNIKFVKTEAFINAIITYFIEMKNKNNFIDLLMNIDIMKYEEEVDDYIKKINIDKFYECDDEISNIPSKKDK